MIAKHRVQKYIRIEERGRSDSGKTRVWDVINDVEHQWVGQVHWYGGFRGYCFFPSIEALYDHEALQIISDFCKQQTIIHHGRQDHTTS